MWRIVVLSFFVLLFCVVLFCHIYSFAFSLRSTQGDIMNTIEWSLLQDRSQTEEEKRAIRLAHLQLKRVDITITSLKALNYIHKLRHRKNTKGMEPKWVLHLYRKRRFDHLYSFTWGTLPYRDLGKRARCCTVLMSLAFKQTLSMSTRNKSGSRKKA